MHRIRVFYDGACPVCLREMAWYRRYTSEGEIDWFDITGKEDELRRLGIDPVAALLELHVLSPAGVVTTGVDAFILLWQRAPRFKALAWLCSLPLIKPLLHRGYSYFTRRRLQRDGRYPCRR